MPIALDGSENTQMSFNSIPNFELSQQFVAEEFKLLDNNKDEDDDASEIDKNNKLDFFDWSGDIISCWAVIIIWSNFTLQVKLKLLNQNCKFYYYPMYKSPVYKPPAYKPIKKPFWIA